MPISSRKPWLCITAAFCMALALCAGWAQTTKSAKSDPMEAAFEAAMTAQQQGDLARAESLLRQLHERHAGIFAVDESLGLLLVAQSRYAEAQPLLLAAVREQPRSDAALANLAAADWKLERRQEALAGMQSAVKLNPRNLSALQSLASMWMEMREPKRAAETLAAALRLAPDRRDLQIGYAQAAIEAGDTARAIATLHEVPDGATSDEVQSLLGDALEKSGQYQQAAQAYLEAARLTPSEANTWAVGVEFLRHWTFEAAVPEFESAVTRFPQSTRMKLGLGAAYFGNAAYARAVPVFADLLEADANNALYAEMLGLACNAVTQEAKPRCTALLAYAQAHPGDAKAATYAAATLLDGQQAEDQLPLARKLLESALAADPKLPDAQFRMGVLKQNLADWTGSIKNLEAAVALKPDFAQAHYRLALAYWRTGRKQDGQTEMELQKKYSKQEQQDLDQRLRQITRFLVDVRE